MLQSAYLLYDSTTIHLQRQIQHLPFHSACEDSLLVLVPMFEELLDNIITEYILHQL